ncbi:MAG: hypothetical protein RIC16_02320 [Rhodospirillales bacterium]
MSDHVNIVVSRVANLMTRIRVKDPDFDQLCLEHAAITTEIRRLDPERGPAQAERDRTLRAQRAIMEKRMFAILQANSDV